MNNSSGLMVDPLRHPLLPPPPSSISRKNGGGGSCHPEATVCSSADAAGADVHIANVSASIFLKYNPHPPGPTHPPPAPRRPPHAGGESRAGHQRHLPPPLPSHSTGRQLLCVGRVGGRRGAGREGGWIFNMFHLFPSS